MSNSWWYPYDVLLLYLLAVFDHALGIMEESLPCITDLNYWLRSTDEEGCERGRGGREQRGGLGGECDKLEKRSKGEEEKIHYIKSLGWDWLK